MKFTLEPKNIEVLNFKFDDEDRPSIDLLLELFTRKEDELIIEVIEKYIGRKALPEDLFHAKKIPTKNFGVYQLYYGSLFLGVIQYENPNLLQTAKNRNINQYIVFYPNIS